jgi:EAL domain-containing protein (putative c-di-GMP-specific phosphodiesterase class I)
VHATPSDPRTPAAPPADEWALEHFDAESRNMVRFRLAEFPVRIGRRSGLELPLLSPSISSLHAEIRREDGGLVIADLGSTNGTFVNDRRLDAPIALAEGDIVHLASLEFRLVRIEPAEATGRRLETMKTMSIQADLPSLLREAEGLKRLIAERAVAIHFQPIVSLAGGATVALEALGRGASDGAPRAPYELFKIAASIGAERELSRLLRQSAAAAARAAGVTLPIFVNIHPAELEGGELLAELRAGANDPRPSLVLELSEHYGGDAATLRGLRDELAALGLRLAYDDFGAGLARINELAEAPAHYLKFDAALVAGIDRAGDAKRRLVGTLVAAARELGMVTLAEGVETAEEAAVCRELGFELGQGYHWGRPEPLPPRSR